MTTLSDLWTGAKRAAVSAVGTPAPQLYTQAQYTDMLAEWRLLADCYSGKGGFKDATHLVAHVREYLDYTSPNPSRPGPKLVARRRLARYENWARLIVDAKVAALFRTPPTRQVKEQSGAPHPIMAWWENIDSRGTHIDDYVEESWLIAAIFGHIVLVMDRPAGPPPLTKADEKPPYVLGYCPADVPDWSFDGKGNLTGLRLLEAVPRASVTAPLPRLGASRSRILTMDGWTLLEGDALINSGTTNYGCIPAVYLFAARDPLAPFVGSSVLGSPKIYLDEFNLTSEIRELLRSQIFGMLNVPLGSDGKVSVQQARDMMGQETGTGNVLFTPEAASFISPSADNIKSYQQERAQLVRNMFRLASVPFESDSKDAEAEGSLRLKREAMNQTLANYADQCERADYELAKLWFRFTYGARWQQEWDAAEVVIRYPDTFDVTPFQEILDQAMAATTLEMGPRFSLEQKKRLVPRFLPDAPADVVAEIYDDMTKQTDAGRPRARLMDALPRTAPAA